MTATPSATIDAGGRTPGRSLLWVAIGSWFVLMWPVVDAGALVLDEHGSYWIIDSDLPGTSLRRSLDYAAIPPLSSWLQQAVLTVLGRSELTFRLSSIVCALAAIVVTYRAGQELGGRMTGGIAAVFVAWHPEAMDEVRIARCYGLVLLLGAVVLLTTVRWQRDARSTGRAVCWSTSCAALLWTHYTSALLVIVSGLAVAAACIGRRDFSRPTWLRLIAAAGLVTVGGLPLVPAVLRLQQWGPMLNFGPADVSLGDVLGPFWWIGVPLGLLTLAWRRGFGRRGTVPWSALWLTAACALLPLLVLALLASGEMSSLANPRYRVAYAPAGACFVALLLTSRLSPSVPIMSAVATLSTLTVLSVSWMLSERGPFDLGRLGSPADQEWRALNDDLAQQAVPREPILVQSGLTEGFLVPIFAEDRLFMEYVACRAGRFYLETPHPRYALPFLWEGRSDVRSVFEELLRSWQHEPGSFWVACATDTDLNRRSLDGIRAIAESQGFEAIETRTREYTTLLHYRISHETAP